MKNFLNNKILFLVLILFLSCCKKDLKNTKKDLSKECLKSVYFSNERVLELKFDVINKGDSYSYGLLNLYYSYNPRKYYELLPISIIMANKYKNVDSYIDVYRNLIMINTNGVYNDSLINNLDENCKKMAISYLIKGKDESPSCLAKLELLYRKGFGVTQSTKKADSLSNIFYENNKYYPNRNIR